MDRILFGNTGSFTGDFPDEYYRAESTGLFISKPGANVFSCNAADLMFSTDPITPGFVQVLGSGEVLALKAEVDGLGNIIATETIIDTMIRSPHYGEDEDDPLMVQWYPIAGLGRDYGSNVFDCMGGYGTDSWDGDGVNMYGLPNGYNPHHTGEWEHGTRPAFWQYPESHPYHLSNTCITNDPSAFFWSWWQQPALPEDTYEELIERALAAGEGLEISEPDVGDFRSGVSHGEMPRYPHEPADHVDHTVDGISTPGIPASTPETVDDTRVFDFTKMNTYTSGLLHEQFGAGFDLGGVFLGVGGSVGGGFFSGALEGLRGIVGLGSSGLSGLNTTMNLGLGFSNMNLGAYWDTQFTPLTHIIKPQLRKLGSNLRLPGDWLWAETYMEGTGFGGAGQFVEGGTNKPELKIKFTNANAKTDIMIGYIVYKAKGFS